jgi:hypothetical protein
MSLGLSEIDAAWPLVITTSYVLTPTYLPKVNQIVYTCSLLPAQMVYNCIICCVSMVEIHWHWQREKKEVWPLE